MSSCLANGTFVICSRRIENTTTRPAPTYHCRRMRRSRAPSRLSARRWPCLSWAASITNMSEREFPTGTPPCCVRVLSQSASSSHACTPSERPRTGPEWVHEIKHDGYRLMVRRIEARVRLSTRRGYDWSDRYPRITEQVPLVVAKVVGSPVQWLSYPACSRQALMSALPQIGGPRAVSCCSRWRPWPNSRLV
jgi:hypothetical protein